MYEHFYLNDYNISCFLFSKNMARHPLQLRRLLRLSKDGDAILFRWISSAHFDSLIFNMTLDSLSQPGKAQGARNLFSPRFTTITCEKWCRLGGVMYGALHEASVMLEDFFTGRTVRLRNRRSSFMELWIIQQPLLSSASNPRARRKLFPLNDKQGKV